MIREGKGERGREGEGGEREGIRVGEGERGEGERRIKGGRDSSKEAK